MAKSLCFILLCLLVIFNSCSARRQQWRQNECQISRLTAQRPSNRIQSEAGVTEVFDHNNDQFQCARVAVVRYTIEPRSWLLPSFVNAPQLIFNVQGRGLLGIMITGCPETYQTFPESQQEQQGQQGQQGREQEGQQGQQGREQEGQQGQQGREQEGQQGQQGREQEGQQGQQGREQEGQQGQQGREQEGQQGQQGREQEGQQGQQGKEQEGQQGQQFRGDQHQKIREIEEGEVAAVPTGVGHYIYNDGNRRLVVVSVIDVGNEDNQLDFHPRRTYLFGNPQNEFPLQQEQEEGEEQEQGSQGRRQQQEGSNGNLFRGFDTELLAEAFQVDAQIIRKLQGQNDRRGNIVRLDQAMEGLVPPRRQQQQDKQQQYRPLVQVNGLEETLCSLRLTQSIGDPRRADVYTPKGGYRTSVTRYDLPVLGRRIRLSVHQGRLHQNAMMLPYFNVNANSILYVIRGRARIQVVQHQGRKVFNEEVQQGQVLIIPQNFAALIKARDSGFQYVAVKTNDEATINTLAGNLSLLRAIPAQLVASAIQGSNDEAKQLKFNRQEMVIAAPGSSRFEYRASA